MICSIKHCVSQRSAFGQLVRLSFVRKTVHLGLLAAAVLIPSALFSIQGNAAVSMPTCEYNRENNSFDASMGGLTLQAAAWTLVFSDGRTLESKDAGPAIVHTKAFRDTTGSGWEIIATEGIGLVVQTRLRCYKGQGITLEYKLLNKTSAPVCVREMQVLKARAELTGGNDLRALCIAPCLESSPDWGGGSVARLGSHALVSSWWAMPVGDAAGKTGFVLGGLTFQKSTPVVNVRQQDNGYDLGLVAHYTGLQGTAARNIFGIAGGIEVPAGGTLDTDRVALTGGGSAFAAMDLYGQMIRSANAINSCTNIPAGWCSWYCGGTHEDTVVRLAEFASQKLKDWGFAYVQIDDGWQKGGRWWRDGKWPHGMKWLGDQIHAQGLKAGVWVVPFGASADADVYRDSSLFVKDTQGKRGTGGWSGCTLDGANSDTQAYLAGLAERFTFDWGYDYVKCDGLYGAEIAGTRATAEDTPATAFHKGMKAFREGCRPGTYLLACGTPFGWSAGEFSGLRIGGDAGAKWESALACAKILAIKNWMGTALGNLDADVLILRAPLTVEMGRAWASVIAMGGGLMMSSDLLMDLPEDRLATLKSVMPVYPGHGQPVDVFDSLSAPASLWRMPVKTRWGEWEVVAVFNWGNEPVTRRIKLEQLGIPTGKTYLASEYWTQEFMGEITNELTLNLPANGVRVVAIREEENVPQVMGSNRHLLQGAVEIQSVGWNNNTRTLSGVMDAIAGQEHVLAIHAPSGFRAVMANAAGSPTEYAETQAGLIRVQLKVSKTGPVTWQVRFDSKDNGAGRFGKAGFMSLETTIATTPPHRPAGLLQPFSFTNVALTGGPMAAQARLAREFFLALPEDKLLNGFRRRAGLPAPGGPMGGWYDPDGFAGGHPFGQYISALARMHALTGDRRFEEKVARLVHGFHETIAPDGFFFSSPKVATNWPCYIYDKNCIGMRDAFTLASNEEALVVLKTMTDWAFKNLPRRSDEWYTLPENLYGCFALTHDDRYLEMAREYDYSRDYYDAFAAGKNAFTPERHAYSHVNALCSAGKIYEATGDEKYFQAVTQAWDFLTGTQMYASGGWGPNERFVAAGEGKLAQSLQDTNFHFRSRGGDFYANDFETPCGSYATINLDRYLLRFTGDPKYGDNLERVLFNGILAALPMQINGETFYYSDYHPGARKQYFPWRWPCCSGTYAQVTADYPLDVYFHDENGLYVNLFAPSQVRWPCAGERVTVDQSTDFPRSDTTTFRIHAEKATRFAFNVRVPRWAGGPVAARVNGRMANATAIPGTFLKIDRRWQDGDTVTVRFPMRLRFEPVDAQTPELAALMYGPILLVALADGEVNLCGDNVRPERWIEMQDAATLTFRAADGRMFRPFYLLRNERYTTYCHLVAAPRLVAK
jgi:DUF1680 family protein